MFKMRPGIVQDKTFEGVYARIVHKLREEAAERPGFGMIEELMIERVAAGYVIIRDREARGIGQEGVNPEDPTKAPGFVHERNYREIVATWYDMASRLQAAQAKAGVPIEGLDEIREDIEREIGEIVGAILDAQLPKAEAKSVKARLAEEFNRRAAEVPVR
jgi:hypothetical protein